MELIDKNKFLEYLDNDCHDVIEDCGDYSELGYSDQQIENAINFAKVNISVVHGHWEHNEAGANFCSECGKYPYDDGERHLVWYTDYCPHCGAKMVHLFRDVRKNVN